MNKVIASHLILINRSPEVVWDYTQNWSRRSEWDRSIVSAEYISQSHPVSVKVKGTGGISFIVTYKVSQRPKLTTLVMSDVKSFWIKGGGGSWKYESNGEQTRWTQHNTLILRDDFLGILTKTIFLFMLKLTTKQMMKRAKKIIENEK